MIGQFRLQRSLQDCFRELFQEAVLADDVFRLLVIGQQLVYQCLVDRHRFPFSSSDGRLHSSFYTLGSRLASCAFRSSITRLHSPGGIASTSRVRFGSFAVMIACAASISLCHSAWRNTSQRSTCTHRDRGNSTEGDTPSRFSNSAYRSDPAAYVITPFVSFTGFIIANSFPPIDLFAAQN